MTDWCDRFATELPKRRFVSSGSGRRTVLTAATAKPFRWSVRTSAAASTVRCGGWFPSQIPGDAVHARVFRQIETTDLLAGVVGLEVDGVHSGAIPDRYAN